jgi:hypothetical protein
MTTAELKNATRRILTSGRAHPPTLPEVLSEALAGSGKKPSAFPEPGTKAWCDARKMAMRSIAREQEACGVQWSEQDRQRSNAAIEHIERSVPQAAQAFDDPWAPL